MNFNHVQLINVLIMWLVLVADVTGTVIGYFEYIILL